MEKAGNGKVKRVRKSSIDWGRSGRTFGCVAPSAGSY